MSYARTAFELDSSERWLIEQVAERRQADAFRLSRLPQLGARDMTADVLGAAGEYAVSRFTGYHWNALRDSLENLPDVGESFDAKAVTRRSDSLLVPEGKLRPGWSYFVVLVELPRVEILGAVEGGTITPADVDRNLPLGPAHRIRQSDRRFIRGEALERFRAPSYDRRLAA